MNPIYLSLTPRDPIVARDGRPFGAGQGNRMRGLAWPLPSVVAGSFRTALVKAASSFDFTGDMPQRLMAVEVAGVFPVHNDNGELYLPTPSDCIWDENTNKVHRVVPIDLQDGEGVDFPVNGVKPVRLTKKQAAEDFKARSLPAWWPQKQMVQWLTSADMEYRPDWFSTTFLNNPVPELRDHVCLDPERGAAAESQLFATAGLNVTHLPRFFGKGSDEDKRAKTFADRFAEITLSARVTVSASGFEHVDQLKTWHPLGGERRLVHWHHNGDASLWTCPEVVKQALASTTQIRMVLATPAVFKDGWKPRWLNDQLEGSPPGTNIKLKLVGVSNGRWKAVSGWSLAKINNNGELDPQGKPGPKPIRRMVPAGSVYFFTTTDKAESLAGRWLQSVSDGEQEQRDGFGLAVWGIW